MMNTIKFQRQLILITLLLGVVFAVSASNRFYAKPFVILPGETSQLEFVLQNDQDFYGFQASIQLPSGLSFVTDASYNYVINLSERANNYMIVSNHSSGVYTVGAFSLDHTAIEGNDGVLLIAEVKASNSFQGGIIKISDIRFTDSNDQDLIFDDSSTEAIKFVGVTGVSVDKETISLKVSEQTSITATVTPADATNKTVTWISDDPSVATVDSEGNVMGISIGNATVTAECGGYTATCFVNVEPTPVTSINLSSTSLSIEEGMTSKLTATVLPDNATDKTVNWSTSDTSIATVSSDGIVSSLKEGSAVITATAADGSGVTATCILTVNAKIIKVFSITLSETSWNGTEGESFQLTATVLPENATDKTVNWSTSDATIATVSSEGKVTALKAGNAVVMATAADGSGENASCNVTVTVKSPTRVSVSSITLSQTSWIGEEGSTFKLTASVLPENATNKGVTWSSSNASVATVSDDGTVTAVKEGSAVITATAADGSGVNASCNVAVTAKAPTTVSVSSITLSQTSWSGEEGSTFQLTASVLPENATNKGVTWSSSNASVATVSDDGTVTAVKAGMAVITATAADGSGVKASCNVTVTVKSPTRVSVSSIILSQTSWSGEEGSTFQLTASVLPENATNKGITWSSSNASVATVSDDGTVTAVKEGSAVITATAADGSGVKASCNVTVTAKSPTTVSVSSITLSQTSWSGEEGSTFKLTASVLPENATNRGVTWSSSNASVATVSDDGTVTAVKEGSAVITATAADGSEVKANCNVTVTSKSPTMVSVSSITLSQTSWSGEEGSTFKLTASVLPENATNKGVTWSSSNTSVATVSDDGTVTAVKAGTAVITATAADGSGVKASCNVTVISKEPEYIPVIGLSLSDTEWIGPVGEVFTLTATVYPENASDKTVTWTCADEDIANVDANGNVTALAVGETFITASCAGFSAECIVTVLPVLAESLSISPDEWSGEVGDTFQIEATVMPDNTSDKSVKYRSSNRNIATVTDEGVVTIKKQGSCYITVTTKDGSNLTARCEITGLSGVELLFRDSADSEFDVYTQTGVLLRSRCTIEDLKKLQPAIYIVRCGESIKKVCITK